MYVGLRFESTECVLFFCLIFVAYLQAQTTCFLLHLSIWYTCFYQYDHTYHSYQSTHIGHLFNSYCTNLPALPTHLTTLGRNSKFFFICELFKSWVTSPTTVNTQAWGIFLPSYLFQGSLHPTLLDWDLVLLYHPWLLPHNSLRTNPFTQIPQHPPPEELGISL